MSQRSLPVLVLLLVVLGGVAWWVSREPPRTDPTRELALLGDLGGRPQELHLVNRDRTKEYRLVEGSLGWELRHPVEDEANQAWVEMLLGQLGRATRIDAFPDGPPTPKDVAATGLDEPAGILVAKRGDRKLRIEFGRECFPPGRAFARVDGRIYKITLGIESAVDQNLDDLRNPLLFRTSGPGVQLLELRRREGGAVTELRLRRDGNGFKVRGGDRSDEFEADPVEVTKLLYGLLSARARNFLPLAGQAGEPWLRIRLAGNFGEEVAELTDPRAGIVYATKGGRQVRLEVDADSFTRVVERSVEDLISMRLWPFRPSAAARIRIEARAVDRSRAVVLAHREAGPGFRLAQPTARFANDTAVNDLIQALETTRLVAVLGGAARGRGRRALETPEVVVELDHPAGRQALADVEVSLARDGGDIYGRRDDEKTVWRVEAPGFAQLLRPWWDFAELVAFRYSGARPVQRIEVRQDGATRTFDRNAAGRWEVGGKVVAGGGFDFGEVFDTLKQVEATAVVGAGNALLAGHRKLATFEALGNDPGDRKRFSLGAFEVWAGAGEVLWGRRSDDLVVFEIAPRPARVLRACLAWNRRR